MFGLLDKIRNALEYRKNPKYRIIMGIANENRSILSFCAYPIKPYWYNEHFTTYGYYKEDVLENCISFKNQPKLTWYKTQPTIVIWTFKDLLKWRRLLPKTGFKCLQKVDGVWNKINRENGE